jgi:hypothetical protein
VKRLSLLFLVLAVGACSRTPAPEAGELRVTPLGGQVRLIDGDETTTLEEATTIDTGVGILTGEGGRASIELPGGSTMELAPQAEVRLEGDSTQVDHGSVLVKAPDSEIRLTAGPADIQANDSVFRVNRDFSVVLAVYSGSAALLGAGVEVPALREATVVANGQVQDGFRPYGVDPNDEWDIQLLGPAIDLGYRLLNLEKGLTRQLPQGEEKRAVSTALVEEEFPRGTIEAGIRALGSAARVVVAAAIAQQISRADGGPLNRVFQEVVNLQALTENWFVIVAQWGLQDAGTALLKGLGNLSVAIARSVPPLPAPPSSGSPASSPGQSITDDRNPGSNDPSGGDSPGGNGNPTAGDPPPDQVDEVEPEPEADPQCGSTPECALEDVLGDPPPAPGTPGINS